MEDRDVSVGSEIVADGVEYAWATSAGVARVNGGVDFASMYSVEEFRFAVQDEGANGGRTDTELGRMYVSRAMCIGRGSSRDDILVPIQAQGCWL